MGVQKSHPFAWRKNRGCWADLPQSRVPRPGEGSPEVTPTVWHAPSLACWLPPYGFTPKEHPAIHHLSPSPSQVLCLGSYLGPAVLGVGWSREAHLKDGILELDPSTAAQQRAPTLEAEHCSSLTKGSRASAETLTCGGLGHGCWRRQGLTKHLWCYRGYGWNSNCKKSSGTSLVVQRLRLHTSNAGGTGFIPGWGSEIPDAAEQPKNKDKKNRGTAVVAECHSCSEKRTRKAETITNLKQRVRVRGPPWQHWNRPSSPAVGRSPELKTGKVWTARVADLQRKVNSGRQTSHTFS